MNTLNEIKFTKYTGFSPSYDKIQITKKINIINEKPENNYYEQISSNKKFKIPYFQNDPRWSSNYEIGKIDNKYLFSPQNPERKKIRDLSNKKFFLFLFLCLSIT